MIGNHYNREVFLLANNALDSVKEMHLDEEIIRATRQAFDVLFSNQSPDIKLASEADIFADKVVSLLDHSDSPYSSDLSKIFWGADIYSTSWEAFALRGYFFLDRINDIQSIVMDESQEKKLIYELLACFITEDLTVSDIAVILDRIEKISEDEIESICQLSLKFVKNGMIGEDIVNIIDTVEGISNFSDSFFTIADQFINHEIWKPGQFIKKEMNGHQISLLLKVIQDLAEDDDYLEEVLFITEAFIRNFESWMTEGLIPEEIADVITTVATILSEGKSELFSISEQFMEEAKEHCHITHMHDMTGILKAIRCVSLRERERVLKNTNRILDLTKNGIDIGNITLAICELSEEDFNKVFNQSVIFIREGMTGEEVADIIEAVRWILYTTDEEDLLQAKEWVGNPIWESDEELTGSDIAHILEKIVRIPEDERSSAIQALQLFVIDIQALLGKRISAKEKADMMEVIAEMSDEQREDVLKNVGHFIRDIWTQHDCSQIYHLGPFLNAIKEIDLQKRDHLFFNVAQFLHKGMTGADIAGLLEVINRIPNEEISSVCENGKMTIADEQCSGQSVFYVLNAILAIPPLERNQTCMLVNRISELIDLHPEYKYVLLESIRKFPANERESILLSFGEFITNSQLPLTDLPDILQSIYELPSEERLSICNLAKMFIRKIKKAQDFDCVVKSFLNYPNDERLSMSRIVGKFIQYTPFECLFVPHLLSFLQGIPLEEREIVCRTAALFLHQNLIDLDFIKKDQTGLELIDFLEQVRLIHDINCLKMENMPQTEIIEIFKVFSTIPQAKREKLYLEIRSDLSASTQYENISDYIFSHRYAEVLKCSSENAVQAIHSIKKFFQANRKVRAAIVNFIEENENFIEQSKREGKSLKIRQKDNSKLPRSLQINPDGSLYILLNKINKGDRLLGKGAYKKVKGAINLQTGEFVARSAQQTSNNGKKELYFSMQIGDHEGIAKTYAFTQYETDTCYNSACYNRQAKIGVMQKFYNGGDLFDVLKSRERKALAFEEKLLIAEKFLSGLNFLHQQEMIHRDIKPENLFLEFDPKTQKMIDAVIGDFGFVCQMSDLNARKKFCGSYNYLSPELSKILLREGSISLEEFPGVNNYPNDNWAAGIVLYILFKKDVPEWNELPSQPFWFSKLLNNGKKLHQLSILSTDWLPAVTHSKCIGKIITNLLNPDPAIRYSAADALAGLSELKPI